MRVGKKDKLVSRISYQIVKDVAPEELDLFSDLEEKFLKNPGAFLEKDTKKKEELLGFAGCEGVMGQFVTATVFPLVWSVISYIGMEQIEIIKKDGSKALAKKINQKIKGKNDSIPKASKERFKEIREYAFSNALSLGLNKQKAAVLADSIVGKLMQS